MKRVSLSLLFTVGEDPHSEDLEPPSATPEYSGQCPASATNNSVVCQGYFWHLEFHVEVSLGKNDILY